MAVVPAFTSIVETDQAGMTAYYRAPGCNSVTIADVLPILSKINHYEPEYVIGEMIIWDTGVEGGMYPHEYNNCAIIRVIVYNDGWMCAWFDRTDTNQVAIGGAQFVDSLTLEGWGTSLEYDNKFNSCQLKITGSTDPECPVDTVFSIRKAGYVDGVNGRVQIRDTKMGVHFNSGFTYDCNIYMTNGNFIWWGVIAQQEHYDVPSTNSNRLYRAIYQMWVVIKNSSNSTNWSPTDASLVYRYDSQAGSYVDETIDFNDAGLADCEVFPNDEVVNDAFYIGWTTKFNGVTLTMGTLGVGSGVTWEYWNGSAWTTILTCIDGSNGFTTTGELIFDPPDDWSEVMVNTHEYFWIRARVTTASYSITPILTQGRLYSQNNTTYYDTEFGVYNFEFTGANYCLMCGKTYGHNRTDHWYYTILPTKTIYDSVMNVGGYGSGTGDQILFNGKLLHYMNITYGYMSYNLSDFIHESGIQNSISLHCDDYSSNITTGAVIITS